MSCKIDSATREYDLDVPQAAYDGVDDYLLQRWTGADGRAAEGYRSLTEWFNKRLLKRVYDEHNREATGVRLDSEYEALRSDDDLTRRELADDLRAAGIDAEELTSAMISWSTMRHHLKDCLDGSKAPAEASSDWELESVRIAAERTEEKADEALRSLVSKGEIADGDAAEVSVDVQLTCPVCHVRTPLTEAAERGYVCREHADATPSDRAGTDD
ncbi:rod-determining factor RdfA [Halostella litorea]|uniref:rod-determining factor RdfA n=1 Tax=Halostella litorea TaxID=2528831 RepID=UPI00109251E5|nr:rod-determining factor RdfA [Halostella litorea]